MEPNTVYGISKLAGERWIEYYYNKYGVDTRSLRYPGLISYKTEAGGGTTDYAVEIFYEAIRHKKYECFLGPETALPMMFMPDAIKATIDVMEADASKLSLRSSYNVAGISFHPETARLRDQKTHPGIRDHLQARLPPGHCRFLAGTASTILLPSATGDCMTNTTWQA